MHHGGSAGRRSRLDALALIAFTEIARTTELQTRIKGARPSSSAVSSGGRRVHTIGWTASRSIGSRSTGSEGDAGARACSRGERRPEGPRAAKAALSRISGAGWSFFGSRYYFSEGALDRRAVAELWSQAPDLRCARVLFSLARVSKALAIFPSDSTFRRWWCSVLAPGFAARNAGLEPWCVRRGRCSWFSCTSPRSAPDEIRSFRPS